ncbi:unnamed protein product, partial [marine sediment metagenome]
KKKIDVAVDATGFSLRRYNKTWLQNKHRYTSHEYVKLHAAIDMRWRSIISFHFTRT